MGKFSFLLVMVLASAAYAKEKPFTLTDSYYSKWENAGTWFEIVSNPEDDWATWSNDRLHQEFRCSVVTRKKYTAVYRCEDELVLRVRYDPKTQALYINDFRFERFKMEFE